MVVGTVSAGGPGCAEPKRPVINIQVAQFDSFLPTSGITRTATTTEVLLNTTAAPSTFPEIIEPSHIPPSTAPSPDSASTAPFPDPASVTPSPSGAPTGNNTVSLLFLSILNGEDFSRSLASQRLSTKTAFRKICILISKIDEQSNLFSIFKTFNLAVLYRL